MVCVAIWGRLRAGTIRRTRLLLLRNTIWFNSDSQKKSYSVSIHTDTMAERRHAPYAPQDVQKVATLIKGLESSTKSSTKKAGGSAAKANLHCKKTTFPIEGTPEISVQSWRFQEHDYKKDNLPTYARGLFTYRRKDGTPEIAIRGYDKFFNVGEVRDTEWGHVEVKTQGPYELSVKENGCIIFISGLEGGKLLVCSKHSTGPREDADTSHASAGERQMDIHLATVGKTRADLARELRRRNATAVAELCDDSFEEHVLAYDKKAAGLYLHGINLNLPEFTTYPGELVHAFADDWGFKKIEYLIKDDIKTVKTFLEDCAVTGSWNGRDTEGFVIRCQRKIYGSEAFEDWFFKYKFEEPYLMYRQWREVTKAVISNKPPRYKKHKQITEEYLHYARRQLSKNPALGPAFSRNHGIIAMRDGFLKERGLTGSDIIRRVNSEQDGSGDNVMGNLVLLPIASIGCGKTTVAIALSRLFGWGHVQNDNIVGKTNRPKQFATQVCNSLARHPVMIADRNNHQKRERKQIMDDVQKTVRDVRFVALHYVHDPKSHMLPVIRKITRERVLDRGDNHQTIQAGTKSQGEIIHIMEGFLHRFEPVEAHEQPDDGFDTVIDLDISASSRQNLYTIINALHSFYPKLLKDIPAPSELDDAIQEALTDYRPDIKHDLSFKSNKSKNNNNNNNNNHSLAQTSTPAKERKPEYFCIALPSSAILTALERTFSDLPPESSLFYKELQKAGRLQTSFHVTLMHQATVPQNPKLWSSLCSLFSNAANSSSPTTLGECDVQLERAIWDGRVMCIAVRLLDARWESVNPVTHLTVGTASYDIKPKESNALLEKWIAMGSGDEGGIREVEIAGDVDVDVHGTVEAVMQGVRREKVV